MRRVGFWNCEMDEEDFLDYIQAVGIMNTDKIELLHLRGQPVRLLTDQGMDWAINWLIDNHVEIWLNDSWAKLCAWSDVDENDNSGVGRLTSVIDEIKKQTNITEQFITTAHTGRAKHAEGDERARGATALDDWVDSRMVLTLVHTVPGKNNAKLFHPGPDPVWEAQQRWVDEHA